MSTSADLGNITVRKACNEDLEPVYKLSVHFASEGMLRRRDIFEFADSIADFWVATDGQDLIACVGRHIEESDAGPYAVCYNFCVRSSHQGRGIGGFLLEAVLDDARRHGARSVYAASTRTGDWFIRRGFALTKTGQAPAEWISQLDPTRGAAIYMRSLR
ncbi:GNAT family N-acetyltransferase [Streptosporangium canum]|uniref:GNAT family N-acetyltransferase n=1 Tax=Streptosporangium canum TaxID=324952 RepID=UPI000B87B0C9